MVLTFECLKELGKSFSRRHAVKILESGLRSCASRILYMMVGIPSSPGAPNEEVCVTAFAYSEEERGGMCSSRSIMASWIVCLIYRWYSIVSGGSSGKNLDRMKDAF